MIKEIYIVMADGEPQVACSDKAYANVYMEQLAKKKFEKERKQGIKSRTSWRIKTIELISK